MRTAFLPDQQRQGCRSHVAASHEAPHSDPQKTMKCSSIISRLPLRAWLLMLSIAACLLAHSRTLAEEPKPADAGKSPNSAPTDPAPAKKKVKLTGAELYSIHCNRCHPERYATEWTPAQWKTIMLHMRVRANLPAAQAKEIQKFLQEESGS